MSDDKRNKSVYDLVDRMIENESPEAQQGNTLRAAALSPLVGGALERAITAYEDSAEKQVESKMKPAHKNFIMQMRESQVLDAAALHKKFHGRS